jgi:hypothetical protein
MIGVIGHPARWHTKSQLGDSHTCVFDLQCGQSGGLCIPQTLHVVIVNPLADYPAIT